MRFNVFINLVFYNFTNLNFKVWKIMKLIQEDLF